MTWVCLGKLAWLEVGKYAYVLKVVEASRLAMPDMATAGVVVDVPGSLMSPTAEKMVSRASEAGSDTSVPTSM